MVMSISMNHQEFKELITNLRMKYNQITGENI